MSDPQNLWSWLRRKALRLQAEEHAALAELDRADRVVASHREAGAAAILPEGDVASGAWLSLLAQMRTDATRREADSRVALEVPKARLVQVVERRAALRRTRARALRELGPPTRAQAGV